MSRIEKAPVHIVFVTSSLGGGGSERVLITMAKYWATAGRRCTIVTLRADALLEYAAPDSVSIVRLGLIREKNPFWQLTHLARLIRLRRTLLRLKPDVVISFIDKLNAAVLIAMLGSPVPVVATEHLAPWMHPLGIGWELVRRFAYARARAVICPTDGITKWFRANIKANFLTLPYPPIQYSAVTVVNRRRVVIAVGRLVRQKGFDLLIKAFAKIAQRCPDWTLEIAGEGPERTQLETQICSENLQTRIRLLGQVLNLEYHYAQAEIFALSSRHEAYPMALCEAIFAGCCILATDCPTGPREILGGDKAGLLVPPEDSQTLADGLHLLIKDEQLRERMRSEAAKRIPYLTCESIMRGWDKALLDWISIRS